VAGEPRSGTVIAGGPENRAWSAASPRPVLVDVPGTAAATSTQPVTGTEPRRVDTARVAELYRQLLIELGEDPSRDGLRGTPGRVAAWWSEFLDYDPGTTAAVFEYEPSDGDHLLVVGGINVYSLCEHHLLPMRLAVSIGYLPAGQVLGLSKFARIAHAHAHRLQLQERFVDGVAQDVVTTTGSGDVGVVAQGEHLCMSMRGVREQQARTTSTKLSGRLRDEPDLTSQLLTLARSPR
jgi:GTP cyclohydrolase I